MPYTPPDNDAVDAQAISTYTAPDNDAVDATLQVPGPNAPSNLVATQGSARGEIDLTWNDNSTDEDGFYVYRNTSQVADLPADTTSYTDTGLLDGEEYLYEVTAYNADGESDPSNSDSAITILPKPTNVGLSYDGEETITITWDDNSNNEIGFNFYRAQSSGSVVGDYTLVGSVGNIATSFDDTITEFNTTYYYRVQVETTDTTALSAEQSITVGSSPVLNESRIASSGWSVAIAHPQSGRVIRPDVISPNDVQYLPGPNTLPEIRIPVRRAPEWLTEQFDNNPALSVHLDGEELPIDELVDVEQSEGRTVLIGEGGVELRTRVEKEYQAERRPDALVSLVDANTSYATVDNTTGATQSTSTVQSPSGESELEDYFTKADTDPFVFTGGGIKPAQTNYLTEGEDPTTSTGSVFERSEFSGNGTSDGFGLAEGLAPGESATWEFNVDYTIPASDVGVYLRQSNENGGTPGTEYYLNGDLLDTLQPDNSLERLVPSWDNMSTNPFGGSGGGYDGGDLTPANNPHTIEVQTSGGSGTTAIDIAAIVDTRYTYNFDNTVTTAADGNNYLDGPELYPASVNAEFDEHTSAFSIVAGSATATLSDTSGAQALALSNDLGQTYPITASNSTTVSGTFASPGSALNLRATLARYSPNGTRDQTPREGYDAQRLDAYTLDATISAESLLIDESFDNNLVDVLNSITGEQYGWTYSVENGTPTVTVDEPGSTVATRDPEVSEAQINKRVQTYDKITIKGSNVSVSGETFTASDQFVELNEDRIQTGSEAVTDDAGNQYQRGVDYEINYRPGEIRALDGGNLTLTNQYNIDYRHQIVGSYPDEPVSGDTLVRTIPGVVSDRQAQQIAFVLLDVYPGINKPRYSGTIVVPRLDATFDPLKGLELKNLDLPDVATPLSIRGDPELTPLGLTLNVGSAPRLQESLSEISETVGSLAERS